MFALKTLKSKMVKMLIFIFCMKCLFGHKYLLNQLISATAALYVASLHLSESVAGCSCGCADKSSSYECTYLSAGRALHMIFIHIFASQSLHTMTTYVVGQQPKHNNQPQNSQIFSSFPSNIFVC